LRRRPPPILIWHGLSLERGLRILAAPYAHLEELCVAAGCGELQIALGAVYPPEQIRAARNAAAIVDRQSVPTLEQSADYHLIILVHGFAFAHPRHREGLSAHGRDGRELSDLAEAVTQGIRRWPSATESIVAPFFL
jgi:hypothetical protein